MRLTKKFNLIINLFTYLLVSGPLVAQQLSLEDCYQKAQELNPIVANELYLSTIQKLQHQNTKGRWMPGVQLEGTASYQSEVITLPFSPPGAEVPAIPKDQYNVFLTINQRIYDGGLTKSSRALIKVQNEAAMANIDVSQYQIRGVVSELFFGILAQQENLKVVAVFLSELANQEEKAKAGYENGIVLESTLMYIRKEVLLAKQKQETIFIQLQSLRDILADWIGEVPAELSLTSQITGSQEFERPEYLMFRKQQEVYDAQSVVAKSRSQPMLNAFVRGGFGQPNPLNFFETDFNPYYIVGARLQWSLWDWGNTKRESQILEARGRMVATQEELFTKNLDNQVIRQQGEVDRLQKLVETDQELLQLQEQIVAEAREQQELGVLSSTDFLSLLSEQQQLELEANIHQIDLLRAKVQLNDLTGKLL